MYEKEATSVSDYVDKMSLASFCKWVQDCFPKGAKVEEGRVLGFEFMIL